MSDPSQCRHPLDACYGNEFNGVVQCHYCGTVFGPITDASGVQSAARIAELQAMHAGFVYEPIPAQEAS